MNKKPLNERKEDFIEICRDFDNAMLVTQSENEELFARPMIIAQLDNDGDLWFATDRNSGKVDEILAHQAVCITMSNGSQFVSISGRAEVIGDQARIDELWSEAWRVWFPDGANDPNLVLLRVHASSGEFWSNAGTNQIKYAFEAAKAYLSGRRPETDDSQHARVKLD